MRNLYLALAYFLIPIITFLGFSGTIFSIFVFSVYAVFLPIFLGRLFTFQAQTVGGHTGFQFDTIVVNYFVGVILSVVAIVAITRSGAGIAEIKGFFLLSLILTTLHQWKFPIQLARFRLLAPIIIFALVAIVIDVISYFLQSEYPIKNLVQLVHFHQAAVSLSDYGILNPFATDSHFPMQQVILGVIRIFTGASLFEIEWLSTYVSQIIIVASYLSLYQTILAMSGDSQRYNTPYTKLLFAGLVLVCIFNFESFTSSTASVVASLTIFSMVLTGPTKHSENYSLYTYIAALVVPTVGWFLLKSIDVFILLPILIMIFILVCWALQNAPNKTLILASLLLFLTLFIHRGALLLVVFLATYFVVMKLLVKLMKHRRGIEMSLYLGSFLFIIALAMVAIILLTDGDINRDLFHLFALFDFAVKPILGYALSDISAGDDITYGLGARINLFEMVRSLPLFLMAPFLLLIYRLAVHLKKTGQLTKRILCDDYIIPLSIISLLFVIISLSGFPFIHRYNFLIIALICAVFTLLCMKCFQSGLQIEQLMDKKFLQVSLIGAVVINLVLFSVSRDVAITYVQLLSPTMVGLLLLIAGLTWLHSYSQYIVISAFLLIGFFSNFTTDTIFISQKFKNDPAPVSRLLSHIQPHFLELDEYISSTDHSNVIISSTSTMAFMMSRYGFLPVTSFSNLDTIEQQKKNELFDAINRLTLSNSTSQGCGIIDKFVSNFASGSLNYIKMHRSNKDLSGNELLAVLSMSNSLIPFPLLDVAEQKSASGIAVSGKTDNGSENLFVFDKNKEEHKKLNYWVLLTANDIKALKGHEAQSYFPKRERLGDISHLDTTWQNINDWAVLKKLKC